MSGKIAVITGPTATGKTALGVILAQCLDGEVVSADSMQLYRRMDIGTAKPTLEEMQGVPHHMIDIAEPQENYSVGRYVSEASACVDDILARGKLPIVVGGTGLYIDSLISGLDFAAAPGDGELRERLSAEYDELGGEMFREKLAKFDPERAQKLHPGDKKRLVRAMEVYTLTGRTITEHDEESRTRPPRYEAAKIALNFRDRQDLYGRIDRRVDVMMELGLEREVRALLESGVPGDGTAMQAIGYKELVRAISGEISTAEAVALIKQESRRYAKRQLTWLRRDSGIFWIEWENHADFDLARRLSTAFLARCGIK
ncbi:MAG: tRNA (adenosine(37)-N6)-dimethylallyltransferase MiaA [Candidatus Heteroscillospira sp.]|jgi:tRNA dimethylallyltransferase